MTLPSTNHRRDEPTFRRLKIIHCFYRIYRCQVPWRGASEQDTNPERSSAIAELWQETWTLSRNLIHLSVRFLLIHVSEARSLRRRSTKKGGFHRPALITENLDRFLPRKCPQGDREWLRILLHYRGRYVADSASIRTLIG